MEGDILDLREFTLAETESYTGCCAKNIFGRDWAAAREFPVLFTSQNKPDNPAPLQQLAVFKIQATFGMDEPSKELANALKQLYAHGEYADLVITCYGKQYQVHKAIVCPRSDFFAAACRGDMKEARTGIIDLPDDDPYVVDMMVYYFYHLDYKKLPLYVSKEDGTIDQTDSNNADNAMPSPPYSNLVIHAKVYALAAKYFIGGLKALALRKFMLAIGEPWAPEDLLEAAEEVYTSTLESDRGLRDAVVKTLGEQRELLANESLQGILKRLNPLTYDLLMYMNENVVRWY